MIQPSYQDFNFFLFTVRVAAEAILKGENPIPAQGDNSGKQLDNNNLYII